MDLGGVLEVEAPHLGDRWVWGEEFVQRTPGFLSEGRDGWSRISRSTRGKLGLRGQSVRLGICFLGGVGGSWCPRSTQGRAHSAPAGVSSTCPLRRGGGTWRGGCPHPAPTPGCGLRPRGGRSPGCLESPSGRLWWGPGRRETGWDSFHSPSLTRSACCRARLRPRIPPPLLLRSQDSPVGFHHTLPAGGGEPSTM